MTDCTMQVINFTVLSLKHVWHEQEIQEYVLKATGGASSSDPFEVNVATFGHAGIVRQDQYTLQYCAPNACCWRLSQGMSPEEINQYVEKQGGVPAV